MQRTRYSSQILMKLEFSRQFFEKYSNVKFHENPPSGSQVLPCGLTERQDRMTKLTVTLFAILRTRLKVKDNIQLRSLYFISDHSVVKLYSKDVNKSI